DRRGALQDQPPGAGRVCAALPAADGGGTAGGQVHGRDRADEGDDGGDGQGDRRQVDEGRRRRPRRVQPPGHDARGAREVTPRIQGGRQRDGGQLVTVLGRR